MTSKKILGILLALCIMLLSAAAMTEEENAAPKEEKINYFTQIDTVDIFGKPFDAKTLEGKPIMINIWADWCKPCVHELPIIDELSKEYKDEITIIGLFSGGIGVDNGNLIRIEDEIEKAKKLYEEKGLSFTTLIADKSVLLELLGRADVMPTTWFIDKDGQPITLIKGARDKAQWNNVIQEVLKELQKGEDDGAKK